MYCSLYAKLIQTLCLALVPVCARCTVNVCKVSFRGGVEANGAVGHGEVRHGSHLHQGTLVCHWHGAREGRTWGGRWFWEGERDFLKIVPVSFILYSPTHSPWHQDALHVMPLKQQIEIDGLGDAGRIRYTWHERNNGKEINREEKAE